MTRNVSLESKVFASAGIKVNPDNDTSAGADLLTIDGGHIDAQGPFSSHVNFIDNRQDALLNLIEKHGILPWSDLTAYEEGALCKVGRTFYQLVEGGDGTQEPSTDDGANWEEFTSGGGSSFVDVQTEEITLALDQTEVSLTNASTSNMELYIEGAREFDFTVTGQKTFELPESFPAGTRIWVVSAEVYADAENIIVESTTGSSRTLKGWVDGQVYTYETVADMTEDERLAVGAKVRTLGYYSPGDGGGNDYEIVAAGTGADDGGSFIDLSGSGLQAKGLFESVVNVTQFGALGDGVSMNADSLQSALDAALALAERLDAAPVLFFPTGRYRLERPIRGLLSSSLYTGLVIRGEGPYASKLIADPSNSYRYVRQGWWDANTNTPALTSGIGTKGDVWVVSSQTRSQNLDGTSVWNIGDQVYFDGEKWVKILTRSRYLGEWDADVNSPDLSELSPEIGDFFTVSKSGATNVDGEASWILGEEVYFDGQQWRKQVLNVGNNKGTWNARDNIPEITPGVGVKGDWYVVDTSHHDQPLDENSRWYVGDKVFFDGKYWRKAFATNMEYGSFDPTDDTVRADRFIGGVRQKVTLTLDSAEGVPGEIYYARIAGFSSLSGTSVEYDRFQQIQFDGEQWRTMAIDPGWNVGLIHVEQDDYSYGSRVSGLQFVSELDSSQDPDLTNGTALRWFNTASPINNGGRNSDIVLAVENCGCYADDSDAGASHQRIGLWEHVVYTHNLGNPNVQFSTFRAPSGPSNPSRGEGNIRSHFAAIRHLHPYLPTVENTRINGVHQNSILLEGLTWDRESTSWEGGYLEKVGIAESDHGLFIKHRMPYVSEPEFGISSCGFKSYKSCIRIYGHKWVMINDVTQIIEHRDGMSGVVSGMYFEMCDDANISNVSFNSSGDSSGSTLTAIRVGLTSQNISVSHPRYNGVNTAWVIQNAQSGPTNINPASLSSWNSNIAADLNDFTFAEGNVHNLTYTVARLSGDGIGTVTRFPNGNVSHDYLTDNDDYENDNAQFLSPSRQLGINDQGSVVTASKVNTQFMSNRLGDTISRIIWYVRNSSSLDALMTLEGSSVGRPALFLKDGTELLVQEGGKVTSPLYATDGSDGTSGSFLTADGKQVIVRNGIVTAINDNP